MSLAVTRILWQCPGCWTRYALPEGASHPDLCPSCQRLQAGRSKKRGWKIGILSSLAFVALSVMCIYVMDAIDPDKTPIRKWINENGVTGELVRWEPVQVISGKRCRIVVYRNEYGIQNAFFVMGKKTHGFLCYGVYPTALESRVSQVED